MFDVFDLFWKKKEIKTHQDDVVEMKVTDIISPPSVEVKQNYIKIEEKFAKTFFIFSYPRYISVGWMSPVINLNIPITISFFLHPFSSEIVLKKLRKRITEVQADINQRQAKGLIRDPQLDIAFRDIEDLRNRLQTAQEKMFKVGIYITVFSEKEEDLKKIETTLRSILESKLVYIKPTLYQQKEGFISTSPYGLDKLLINTPMNTEPLSSVFPFVSSDLSSGDGVLYGVNLHNNSLVLFDRFSLENANMVVFAKSGSGKSYFVKLEALRYLMMGVDVIVLDPDNEYKTLADAVGGSFFNMSLTSNDHINPFDLPEPREGEDPKNILRSNIINLVGLIRIMFGGLTPEEDAIMDRALTETYAARDITEESDPATWKDNIPTMSDLESVLIGLEGTEELSRKLRKYTKGNYAEFFNSKTNISTEKSFISFGIRDLEEGLSPMAMYIIMRYIWNSVVSKPKKRIFIIDESWMIMQNKEGASFLYGLVKRARKYWLGVTTITQDVEDFMASKYGKPIVTNSSLQFLLKQSTASANVVQETFFLTDAEKMALLECQIGEGLFIAGKKRAMIKVTASYSEDQFITTSPEELAKIKKAKQGY